MLKEPREQFNARWRKYHCQVCGKHYDEFTVKPVPKKERVCYLCLLARRVTI